jgi:hypothetical protein
MLFHEALEDFWCEHVQESFERFEGAAAKGHEESIWIMSVVKRVGVERGALKAAFARTEEPLGWYLAGQLNEEEAREQFELFKKSAEGGCSWGLVEYGSYFEDGGNEFEDEDEKRYIELLEKAANLNNPEAMHWLGGVYRFKDDAKSFSFYAAAAKLGWLASMDVLSSMYRFGEGHLLSADWSQAAIWAARGLSGRFWNILRDATEELPFDFDQLCYSLGWGLYWFMWGREDKFVDFDQMNDFLDYYCSCADLQQESIFTFLLFWNRTVRVKDVGVLIGKKVWEERKENLVTSFQHWKDSNN